MADDRAEAIAAAFLRLTDTLVQDYDPADYMADLTDRAITLFEVTAAGVILEDPQGRGLSVAAASSRSSRLLEDFAIATEAGPCIDCVRTGSTMISPDLERDADRWPRFVAGAREAGFRACHAVPMCLRGQVIGVLTLLHDAPHLLSDSDARLAQALADAATIGLLHERALHRAEEVAGQLQHALNSRVLIEQAKGMLSQQAGISPQEAFAVLRASARRSNVRLAVLSERVIAGVVDHAELAASR
jgi:GAF domain-containing protein